MGNNHIARNMDLLVGIIKAITEKRESCNPVEIWDKRTFVMTKSEITATSSKVDVSREINDEDKLTSDIVDMVVNENSFQIRIRHGEEVYDVKWSFQITFGEIRNFIENIIKPNIDSMSDDHFRTLVTKILPEKLKTGYMLNPVLDFVVNNIYDSDISDKRFKKGLKQVLLK